MPNAFRIGLAFLCFACASLLAEEKPPAIKLPAVTATELTKIIESHKGKVVVVDVWAEYCIPCRKKFPLMLQLHKDLMLDGLVVIAVTIDEKEDREKAVAFLEKSRARFLNYHLIDTEANIDSLQKTLATKAVPIVHVFDREGKKTSFETGIKDDEVEKLIRELVRRK